MLLGAMLDAGLPLEGLRRELSKLPLSGYSLRAQKVRRAGFPATHAIVDIEPDPPPRRVAEVLRIVEASSLPPGDKEKGLAVFWRLAEAEAVNHSGPVEEIHLHELGAVDAIVDVMGGIAGLRLLGVGQLYCSPLPAGSGEVKTRHGILPVPSPVTLELFARARAPLQSAASGAGGELVTPTGAAIATTLALFDRPEMALERAGYGAGSQEIMGRPNVLRLWLGEAAASIRPTMLLIETNIDDMTPEVLAYVLEKLLAAGAADAWLTPIQMKKGRPGVMLSAICSEALEEPLARLILRETSTLGVRVRPVHRWEAERETLEFQSSLGPAAVKVKRLPGEPPSISPEYEVCKRLADHAGLPLQEVYRTIQREGEAETRRREREG